MLAQRFMFGSLFFWSIIAVEFVLLTWWVENESPIPAFFSVALLLIVFHLFGDVSIFTYVENNSKDVLRWVVVYAFIGFVWSLLKFYFYVSKLKRKIERVKEEFLEDYEQRESSNVRNNLGTKEDKWRQHLRYHVSYKEERDLTFSSYGSRIVFWLSYWPISMFWTLLNDPIRRFSKWCYEVFLVNVFRKIHKSTVGSVTEL
jgi:hypothetical protein